MKSRVEIIPTSDPEMDAELTSPSSYRLARNGEDLFVCNWQSLIASERISVCGSHRGMVVVFFFVALRVEIPYSD